VESEFGRDEEGLASCVRHRSGIASGMRFAAVFSDEQLLKAHISLIIITMHEGRYVWQIPFFLSIYWFKK
jgi:hypothetical protein